MKPLTPDRVLVTVPLGALIRDLLHAEHSVPISNDMAECLLLVTSNKHSCHIQFPSDEDTDITGRLITTPILWESSAWLVSSEKWQRAKIRSQKMRDDMFVLEANINILTRAILRFAYLTPDSARITARILLERKDYKRIEFLGVPKLYEKIEEL